MEDDWLNAFAPHDPWQVNPFDENDYDEEILEEARSRWTANGATTRGRHLNYYDIWRMPRTGISMRPSFHSLSREWRRLFNTGNRYIPGHSARNLLANFDNRYLTQRILTLVRKVEESGMPYNQLWEPSEETIFYAVTGLQENNIETIRIFMHMGLQMYEADEILRSLRMRLKTMFMNAYNRNHNANGNQQMAAMLQRIVPPNVVPDE